VTFRGFLDIVCIEGAFSFPEVRAGHTKGVLMRRFIALLSLLLLVVGCSAGSDSGDISFEHAYKVWVTPDTSVWTATGKAIDNDLFCPAANGTFERYEDEDGATRTSEELLALIRGGHRS